MVTRREWFMAVGGADESLQLTDDVSLQLRLLCLEIEANQPAARTNPPAYVAQALVNWHRGAGNEYREQMLDEYMLQCGAAYTEFFKSHYGQQYKHLEREVVEHLQSQIKTTFKQHFGIEREHASPLA